MHHFQDVVDSSGESPSHPSMSVDHDNGGVSDTRNNQDGLSLRYVNNLNVPVSLDNCHTLLINI